MQKTIKRIVFFLVLLAAIHVVAAGDRLDRDTVHTPEYYEQAVRADFKRGQWERGKKTLDQAMEHYETMSTICELAGKYYLHKGMMDEARFYLIRALRDNNENVEARQMLVDVEDKTHNYSSAICYVNELLEVNPYWVGWWMRKIDLFQKQGNTVEADRLLKRIAQIYPNDVKLRQKYLLRLEDRYQTASKTHKEEAINTLKELIKVNPEKEEYYFDMCNLYLQMGDKDNALRATGLGLAACPKSTALVQKRVGILAEDYRMIEALDFVKASMRVNHDGRLSKLYNELLVEAARIQAMHDPYTLYGKVYEQQKSDESLDYLLNMSITRGYNDDALYYLSEAQKRRGKTLQLRMKEMAVQRRMGNTAQANAILTDLYERYPDNVDVADEIATLRLNQAQPLMADGLYGEALPYLRFARRASKDNEVKIAATSRLATCYAELKRYADAHNMLDSLNAISPLHDDYIIKKADLFAREGKPQAALNLLAEALADSTNAEMAGPLRAQYEEVAVPRIKALIEQGSLYHAWQEAQQLLVVCPGSADGLRYALNATGQLKRYDDYDALVKQGRSLYPDDMFFLAKQATVYDRKGEYRRAIDLLHAPLDSLRGDPVLVAAFSESSEQLALDLMHHDQTTLALEVLDTALVYDSQNRSLLYAKGLVFEKRHDWDSAYVYQKYYQPDVLEAADFRLHLRGLKAQDWRNTIGVEYLQGRYGQEDIITSVATASFTHRDTRDTYTGRMNYAGRDGDTSGMLSSEQTPGGLGIQLQGEWTHEWSPKWTSELSAAWGSRYFPRWNFSLGVTRNYRRGWEVTLKGSYRRIATYKKAFEYDGNIFNEQTQSYGLWTFDHWKKGGANLFTASLGAAKTYDKLRLSLRGDGLLLRSKIYVNASGEVRYFPLSDGETSIAVLGSIGTAPEASLIDNAMPTSFSKTNTMVGIAARYLLWQNVSVGVTGTWHTFYSQLNGRNGTRTDFYDYVKTSYKNLFNINAQLYIRF